MGEAERMRRTDAVTDDDCKVVINSSGEKRR
jgi:hypothetical protein